MSHNQPEQAHDAVRTIDAYLAFVASLRAPRVDDAQFIRAIARVDLETAIPVSRFTAPRNAEDGRIWSIMPASELAQMDEREQQMRFGYVLEYLINGSALLTEQRDAFAAIVARADNDTLREFVERFLDTVWKNRGASAGELEYPERAQCVRVIAACEETIARYRAIVPWFDFDHPEWDLLTAHFRNQNGGREDAAYFAMRALQQAHRMRTAMRTIQQWHEVLAALTATMPREDFAVLAGESISEIVTRGARSRSANPDARTRREAIATTIVEAAQTWYDAGAASRAP